MGYWVVYTQDSAEGSPVKPCEPANYPDFYDNTVISIVDNATNAAPDWLQFGYSANHLNSHLWIKLTENTADAARQAVITFTYPDVAHQYQLRANERQKVITVTQEGAVAEEKPLFNYTFSGSGWNQSWVGSGRSLSYTAEGYTRQASDDWLAPHGIVIAPDLQKLNAGNQYVAYTAGAAYPAEDVAPFVKQALGLSDEAYTSAAAWLTFGVHVEGAQWLIRIDAVAANTGDARSLSGNILNPDGTTYSTYSITQAAGGGSQGGGDFTMPTARESFLAIPGGQEAQTITVVSETEITVGTVRAASEGNPLFVLFTCPSGVTVQSVSGTGFNNANKINDEQAGFWIPSNMGAERTLVGTVTFTDGTATRDLKVNIVQAEFVKNAVELWTSATKTYAKGWFGWESSVNPADCVTIGTNSITVSVPSDKSQWFEWADQNFILTNIVPESGKYYDFSCKITSNHTGESSCTLKLATWNGTSDEGQYFYKGGDSLLVWQAGETCNVFVEGMSYIAAHGTNPLVLLIDLGYNAAGITITVSDISLKEY